MPLNSFHWHKQRQIALIALPMVLSNLCVPLLGLVDTAVVGHLPQPHYLGGVALGGSIISLLYFLLGFLRMSTTGLTAQAYGRGGDAATVQCLQQGIILALALSALLLLLQWPVIKLSVYFSDASSAVLQQAERYFSVRIWGAPATLVNLVLMGWFLGRQNARAPMWLLLFGNAVNIALDLLFVLVFGWYTAGVAAASVIADYATLILALYLLWQSAGADIFNQLKKLRLTLHDSLPLLSLNRDIFLRSLCLQAVFVFIAFQGAAFGDSTLAANAVLLSFLLLVSYALDGLAYAAESLVGNAMGSKKSKDLSITLRLLSFWCLLLSVVFSLGYATFGTQLIALLTSIDTVQQEAARYLPWLMIIPLIASWAFLLDGIFIGATQGALLRNSMFIALLGFASCFWLLQQFENHALWAAMTLFMALRALTLAYHLYRGKLKQAIYAGKNV